MLKWSFEESMRIILNIETKGEFARDEPVSKMGLGKKTHLLGPYSLAIL